MKITLKIGLILKATAVITVFALTLTSLLPSGWASPDRRGDALRGSVEGVEAGLEDRLRGSVRKESPFSVLEPIAESAVPGPSPAIEPPLQTLWQLRAGLEEPPLRHAAQTSPQYEPPTFQFNRRKLLLGGTAAAGAAALRVLVNGVGEEPAILEGAGPAADRFYMVGSPPGEIYTVDQGSDPPVFSQGDLPVRDLKPIPPPATASRPDVFTALRIEPDGNRMRLETQVHLPQRVGMVPTTNRSDAPSAIARQVLEGWLTLTKRLAETAAVGRKPLNTWEAFRQPDQWLISDQARDAVLTLHDPWSLDCLSHDPTGLVGGEGPGAEDVDALWKSLGAVRRVSPGRSVGVAYEIHGLITGRGYEGQTRTMEEVMQIARRNIEAARAQGLRVWAMGSGTEWAQRSQFETARTTLMAALNTQLFDRDRVYLDVEFWTGKRFKEARETGNRAVMKFETAQWLAFHEEEVLRRIIPAEVEDLGNTQLYTFVTPEVVEWVEEIVRERGKPLDGRIHFVNMEYEYPEGAEGERMKSGLQDVRTRISKTGAHPEPSHAVNLTPGFDQALSSRTVSEIQPMVSESGASSVVFNVREAIALIELARDGRLSPAQQVPLDLAAATVAKQIRDVVVQSFGLPTEPPIEEQQPRSLPKPETEDQARFLGSALRGLFWGVEGTAPLFHGPEFLINQLTGEFGLPHPDYLPGAESGTTLKLLAQLVGALSGGQAVPTQADLILYQVDEAGQPIDGSQKTIKNILGANAPIVIPEGGYRAKLQLTLNRLEGSERTQGSVFPDQALTVSLSTRVAKGYRASGNIPREEWFDVVLPAGQKSRTVVLEVPTLDPGANWISIRTHDLVGEVDQLLGPGRNFSLQARYARARAVLHLSWLKARATQLQEAEAGIRKELKTSAGREPTREEMERELDQRLSWDLRIAREILRMNEWAIRTGGRGDVYVRGLWEEANVVLRKSKALIEFENQFREVHDRLPGGRDLERTGDPALLKEHNSWLKARQRMERQFETLKASGVTAVTLRLPEDILKKFYQYLLESEFDYSGTPSIEVEVLKDFGRLAHQFGFRFGVELDGERLKELRALETSQEIQEKRRRPGKQRDLASDFIRSLMEGNERGDWAMDFMAIEMPRLDSKERQYWESFFEKRDMALVILGPAGTDQSVSTNGSQFAAVMPGLAAEPIERHLDTTQLEKPKPDRHAHAVMLRGERGTLHALTEELGKLPTLGRGTDPQRGRLETLYQDRLQTPAKSTVEALGVSDPAQVQKVLSSVQGANQRQMLDALNAGEFWAVAAEEALVQEVSQASSVPMVDRFGTLFDRALLAANGVRLTPLVYSHSSRPELVPLMRSLVFHREGEPVPLGALVSNRGNTPSDYDIYLYVNHPEWEGGVRHITGIRLQPGETVPVSFEVEGLPATEEEIEYRLVVLPRGIELLRPGLPASLVSDERALARASGVIRTGTVSDLSPDEMTDVLQRDTAVFLDRERRLQRLGYKPEGITEERLQEFLGPYAVVSRKPSGELDIQPDLRGWHSTADRMEESRQKAQAQQAQPVELVTMVPPEPPSERDDQVGSTLSRASVLAGLFLGLAAVGKRWVDRAQRVRAARLAEWERRRRTERLRKGKLEDQPPAGHTELFDLAREKAVISAGIGDAYRTLDAATHPEQGKPFTALRAFHKEQVAVLDQATQAASENITRERVPAARRFWKKIGGVVVTTMAAAVAASLWLIPAAKVLTLTVPILGAVSISLPILAAAGAAFAVYLFWKIVSSSSWLQQGIETAVDRPGAFLVLMAVFIGVPLAIAGAVPIGLAAAGGSALAGLAVWSAVSNGRSGPLRLQQADAVVNEISSYLAGPLVLVAALKLLGVLKLAGVTMTTLPWLGWVGAVGVPTLLIGGVAVGLVVASLLIIRAWQYSDSVLGAVNTVSRSLAAAGIGLASFALILKLSTIASGAVALWLVAAGVLIVALLGWELMMRFLEAPDPLSSTTGLLWGLSRMTVKWGALIALLIGLVKVLHPMAFALWKPIALFSLEAVSSQTAAWAPAWLSSWAVAVGLPALASPLGLLTAAAVIVAVLLLFYRLDIAHSESGWLADRVGLRQEGWGKDLFVLAVRAASAVAGTVAIASVLPAYMVFVGIPLTVAGLFTAIFFLSTVIYMFNKTLTGLRDPNTRLDVRQRIFNAIWQTVLGVGVGVFGIRFIFQAMAATVLGTAGLATVITYGALVMVVLWAYFWFHASGVRSFEDWFSSRFESRESRQRVLRQAIGYLQAIESMQAAYAPAGGPAVPVHPEPASLSPDQLQAAFRAAAQRLGFSRRQRQAVLRGFSRRRLAPDQTPRLGEPYNPVLFRQAWIEARQNARHHRLRPGSFPPPGPAVLSPEQLRIVNYYYWKLWATQQALRFLEGDAAAQVAANDPAQNPADLSARFLTAANARGMSADDQRTLLMIYWGEQAKAHMDLALGQDGETVSRPFWPGFVTGHLQQEIDVFRNDDTIAALMPALFLSFVWKEDAYLERLLSPESFWEGFGAVITLPLHLLRVLLVSYAVPIGFFASMANRTFLSATQREANVRAPFRVSGDAGLGGYLSPIQYVIRVIGRWLVGHLYILMAILLGREVVRDAEVALGIFRWDRKDGGVAMHARRLLERGDVSAALFSTLHGPSNPYFGMARILLPNHFAAEPWMTGVRKYGRYDEEYFGPDFNGGMASVGALRPDRQKNNGATIFFPAGPELTADGIRVTNHPERVAIQTPGSSLHKSYNVGVALQYLQGYVTPVPCWEVDERKTDQWQAGAQFSVRFERTQDLAFPELEQVRAEIRNPSNRTAGTRQQEGVRAASEAWQLSHRFQQERDLRRSRRPVSDDEVRKLEVTRPVRTEGGFDIYKDGRGQRYQWLLSIAGWLMPKFLGWSFDEQGEMRRSLLSVVPWYLITGSTALVFLFKLGSPFWAVAALLGPPFAAALFGTVAALSFIGFLQHSGLQAMKAHYDPDLLDESVGGLFRGIRMEPLEQALGGRVEAAQYDGLAWEGWQLIQADPVLRRRVIDYAYLLQTLHPVGRWFMNRWWRRRTAERQIRRGLRQAVEGAVAGIPDRQQQNQRRLHLWRAVHEAVLRNTQGEHMDIDDSLPSIMYHGSRERGVIRGGDVNSQFLTEGLTPLNDGMEHLGVPVSGYRDWQRVSIKGTLMGGARRPALPDQPDTAPIELYHQTGGRQTFNEFYMAHSSLQPDIEETERFLAEAGRREAERFPADLTAVQVDAYLTQREQRLGLPSGTFLRLSQLGWTDAKLQSEIRNLRSVLETEGALQIESAGRLGPVPERYSREVVTLSILFGVTKNQVVRFAGPVGPVVDLEWSPLDGLYDASEWDLTGGIATFPGTNIARLPLYRRRSKMHTSPPVPFLAALRLLEEPPWLAPASGFNRLPTDAFEIGESTAEDTKFAKMNKHHPRFPTMNAYNGQKLARVFGHEEMRKRDAGTSRALQLFKGMGIEQAIQHLFDHPIFGTRRPAALNGPPVYTDEQARIQRLFGWDQAADDRSGMTIFGLQAFRRDEIAAGGWRGAGMFSYLYSGFTATRLSAQRVGPFAPGDNAAYWEHRTYELFDQRPTVGGEFRETLRRIQQRHQSAQTPAARLLNGNTDPQSLLHGVLADPWTVLSEMGADQPNRITRLQTALNRNRPLPPAPSVPVRAAPAPAPAAPAPVAPATTTAPSPSSKVSVSSPVAGLEQIRRVETARRQTLEFLEGIASQLTQVFVGIGPDQARIHRTELEQLAAMADLLPDSIRQRIFIVTPDATFGRQLERAGFIASSDPLVVVDRLSARMIEPAEAWVLQYDAGLEERNALQEAIGLLGVPMELQPPAEGLESGAGLEHLLKILLANLTGVPSSRISSSVGLEELAGALQVLVGT